MNLFMIWCDVCLDKSNAQEVWSDTAEEVAKQAEKDGYWRRKTNKDGKVLWVCAKCKNKEAA